VRRGIWCEASTCLACKKAYHDRCTCPKKYRCPEVIASDQGSYSRYQAVLHLSGHSAIQGSVQWGYILVVMCGATKVDFRCLVTLCVVLCLGVSRQLRATCIHRGFVKHMTVGSSLEIQPGSCDHQCTLMLHFCSVKTQNKRSKCIAGKRSGRHHCKSRLPL
jgi:hypothetical protein